MDNFTQKSLKIFELMKAAKDDESEVASIAVRSGNHILMGKRRDNGRWTMPGGHLDKGEEKVDGAVRELFEESGIRVEPKDLKYLGSKDVTTFKGKKKKIHAFSYEHDGEKPTTKNDPDKEVEKWEWVEFDGCIPKKIVDNAHTPVDKNIVFEKLGLKPEEGLSKSKDDKLPEFFQKHGGLIPKDHPDHEKAVAHISTEYKKGNKNEARRLHDRYISGGGSFTKNEPMLYSKEDIQKYVDPSMDWRHSYLRHSPEPKDSSAPSKHIDPIETFKEQLLNSGKLLYHPKRGYILNRKIEDRGHGGPLMKLEEGPIKLVHYGRQTGLKELDPMFQGTGAATSSFRQGFPEVPRTYFYREGTQPESIVTSGAKSKYTAILHPHQKLYDLSHDPEGIVKESLNSNNGAWNSDLILGNIKNKGYHGFHDTGSNSGVVALFHPHPTHSEEVLRA